ncbi:hypothetical protein EB118_01685 [bacterium]|nr:hypothetical protein [bacterium]NBX97957.1 hypothetical protein [bacterium]NDC94408.1 hypothetical protein [bacterium]NDD83794.1 hypothetical protein [bacterium]NDG28799.1 hypothetical protein [bacterium]
MSDARISIDQAYDPVILDAAWTLRESFLFPGEDESDETQGIYLNQWNCGDELSPGCYNIVEWSGTDPYINTTERGLGVWVTELSKFSPNPKIQESPHQLVSAIIDICLTQDRLYGANHG